MTKWDRPPGLSSGKWDRPPGLSSGMSHPLDALSNQLGRRAPLSGQIAESIRGLIVALDLQPGSRIVESRIARQIGVGQPTVREALVALEHQGLVVRRANQGCVVTSLTRTEICQLKEAASQKDPRQFFDLDFRFHDTLWKLSGNSFLPRLLEQTRAPLLAFLFIRVAKAILSRHKETTRRVTQQKLQMFADQHLAWYE
jgi:DNA-binding GntR family transcriptional regulator